MLATRRRTRPMQEGHMEEDWANTSLSHRPTRTRTQEPTTRRRIGITHFAHNEKNCAGAPTGGINQVNVF